jgi:hypothetical protein
MVTTMGSMSAYRSNRNTESWHLVRKLVLLFLLVTAAALGVVLLFQRNTIVPPVLFSFFADAVLGTLAGLACRMVLRRRHWIVQALASAALSSAGLVLLGRLTTGQLGIGPWDFQPVQMHWLDAYGILLHFPLPVIPTHVNLMEVAEYAICVDMSWVALRAWKRTTTNSGGRSARQTKSAHVTNDRHPRLALMAFATPSARRQPTHGSRPLIRRRGVVKPMLAIPAASRRRPRRSKALRRPEVQLAVHEDHRCPYCLEEVKPNDARGSVECPICHTLHHKDCWDITGTCQVPHLNT